MKKSTIDCVNVVAEKIEISPADFEDVDDYIDAAVCFAESKQCWGPLNASQLSAVKKLASDDYRQFWQAESFDNVVFSNDDMLDKLDGMLK